MNCTNKQLLWLLFGNLSEDQITKALREENKNIMNMIGPKIGETWNVGTYKNLNFRGIGRNFEAEKLFVFDDVDDVGFFVISKDEFYEAGLSTKCNTTRKPTNYKKTNKQMLWQVFWGLVAGVIVSYLIVGGIIGRLIMWVHESQL
jgi:hypothetical protein